MAASFLHYFKKSVLRNWSSKSNTKRIMPHFQIMIPKQKMVFRTQTLWYIFILYSANSPFAKQFTICNFLWFLIFRAAQARCSVRLYDFIPRLSQFFPRKIAKVKNRTIMTGQQEKYKMEFSLLSRPFIVLNLSRINMY